MKHLKTFEKLGIDDLVVKISDLIFEEFLKHYDKSKIGKDKSDDFDVDISEFNITFTSLHIAIFYNRSISSSGFPMKIGVIDRENNSMAKSMKQFKSDILHETQHLVYRFRTHSMLTKKKKPFKKNKDKFEFRKDRKRFIKPEGVTKLIDSDIIGSFRDSEGATYNLKVTLNNFFKYDRFSDTYKKTIAYLYLAEQDEVNARIHEFFDRAKNFKEEYEKYPAVKWYKDMMDFQIDLNNLTENEKNRIYKYIAKPKDIKKIEKYINMQGKKFIRKIHKLSYFQDSES